MQFAKIFKAVVLGSSMGVFPFAWANEPTTSPTNAPGSSHTQPTNTGVNPSTGNTNDTAAPPTTSNAPVRRDGSQSDQDVELTRQIRRELVARSDLSMAAQNIGIVTSKGRVTLQGPVRSENEKNAVIAIAEKHAGNKNVRNRLDVIQ